MKSSSGHYYIGLDHLRAIAAFFVFTWHFIHVNHGNYAPPPLFPLSILSEGHTGVALFMTLSGYLFAKLLDGKKIIYTRFLWNRIIRLAPLLVIIIIIVALQKYFKGVNVVNYIKHIAYGFVMPTLPNGGWSITVEFHFYFILPFLLFLSSNRKYLLVIVVIFAISTRTLLYFHYETIQFLVYKTIVGRIDNFLLGILFYHIRYLVAKKHLIVILSLFIFLVFYWFFDLIGGYYKNPSYPSPSSIWIFMPTIEGAAYGMFIAWYDSSFKHSKTIISRCVALIGECSYSIYLLHFFVVHKMASYINKHVFDLSNIHFSLFFGTICFLLFTPIAYASYKYIEKPFFKFRKRYIYKGVPIKRLTNKDRLCAATTY